MLNRIKEIYRQVEEILYPLEPLGILVVIGAIFVLLILTQTGIIP